MRIAKLLPLFTFVAVSSILLQADSAQADEARGANLAPQVRALLDDLRKEQAATPVTPAPEPATAPPTAPPKSATPPPSVPGNRPKPVATLALTGLKLSGLQTSSLTPSAPLGGHGTTGGEGRLNTSDWRQLFPLKDGK